MKKMFMTLVLASSFGLSACGAAQVASLTGSQSGLALNNAALSATGWELSADDTTGATVVGNGKQTFGPARGGKGVPGSKGGHGGFFGLPMGADLNLSAEQQSQLQTIQSELRTVMEANLPAAPEQNTDKQAQFAAVQTAIKTAFAAERFDASALQTQLAALKPAAPTSPSDAVLDAQVEAMIKSYQILTAEQHQQIADKIAQIGTQQPVSMPSPPAGVVNPLIERLKSTVSLTAEQEATLTSRLEAERSANAPDDNTKHADIQAKATQILSLLNQSNPDKTALKALLQPPVREQKADHRLTELAILHAVLSADQRQAWIDAGALAGGPGGHGGPRGHGGMMKMGRSHMTGFSTR